MISKNLKNICIIGLSGLVASCFYINRIDKRVTKFYETLMYK